MNELRIGMGEELLNSNLENNSDITIKYYKRIFLEWHPFGGMVHPTVGRLFYSFKIFIDKIRISSNGLLAPLQGTFAILSIISKPSVTSPNTV